MVLVRGLVVVVGGVVVLLLLAPVRRPAHEIMARADAERGDAGLGEREVVGAVEVARLGVLVGERRRPMGLMKRSSAGPSELLS